MCTKLHCAMASFCLHSKVLYRILFSRQAETDIEGDGIIAVGNGQTWRNLSFFLLLSLAIANSIQTKYSLWNSELFTHENEGGFAVVEGVIVSENYYSSIFSSRYVLFQSFIIGIQNSLYVTLKDILYDIIYNYWNEIDCHNFVLLTCVVTKVFHLLYYKVTMWQKRKHLTPTHLSIFCCFPSLEFFIPAINR